MGTTGGLASLLRGRRLWGDPAAPAPARSRASQTWAMLIKRVYEVDPLECPQCGGRMKVLAFIEPPRDADGDCQPPSRDSWDVPWEVTGDGFAALF